MKLALHRNVAIGRSCISTQIKFDIFTTTLVVCLETLAVLALKRKVKDLANKILPL